MLSGLCVRARHPPLSPQVFKPEGFPRLLEALKKKCDAGLAPVHADHYEVCRWMIILTVNASRSILPRCKALHNLGAHHSYSVNLDARCLTRTVHTEGWAQVLNLACWLPCARGTTFTRKSYSVLQVLENAYLGIKGGWTARVMWVTNERMAQWEDKLPEATRSKLRPASTGSSSKSRTRPWRAGPT
jgi:hypothetical protein